MRGCLFFLALFVATPSTAQQEPEFIALLTVGRRAIRAGRSDEAEKHLKRAINHPAADGRAYAELASLRVRAGRWDEAMELAQRAYLRAENTWYRHGPQVRGTAAFTLARAREGAGDVEGALNAYLHSLSLRASRSARRSAERLSRTWWGRHRTPPPAAREHLSTWSGEASEASACDGFWAHVADQVAANTAKLDPHRGIPHCNVENEWSHEGARWQLVANGDASYEGEYELWVQRGHQWYAVGSLGMLFSGGDSTDLRVSERGFHRWDGRIWLVLDIEDQTYDPGRCEDTITTDHATVACSLGHDETPLCVQWSRGLRHAHSPSHWYLAPEDRPEIEGYGCPDRPDGTPMSLPPFRPPAHAELGPRGIRLVGDEAPPTLTRWRSPLEVRPWARTEIHQWDRRLWNLARIDFGLLEQAADAPIADASRRIREDIAEFLLPEPDADD